MDHPSGSGRRVAGLAGFCVLLAWGLRALLLAEGAVGPGLCDGRGALSDLGLAMGAAAAAMALGRIRRSLAVAPALAWLLLLHVGYEHVRALAAPIQWREIGLLLDPTFLGGSAIRPSHPWLLLVLTIATVAVSYRAAGPAAGCSALAAATIAGLGLVALSVAVPETPECLAWRQHPLGFGSPFGSPPFVASAAVPSGEAPTPAGLEADLSGASVVAPGARRPRNVLLVMLEGVSGLYLPSVADRHGHEASPALVRLDEAIREGRWAPTFVAQQRQTQRGMYPILCGDLPKLLPAEPRFAELARGETLHPCLPRLLAARGFTTHYLQAAPLAFMQKDRALPVIGFQEVRGDESIGEPAFRTQWGVDDDAFFREAVRTLERLRGQERPWMLGLLTVGTHHPFVVPPSVALEGVPERHRPFVYLDEAFATFWRTLRAQGLLRDTLVVLTSDESLGVETGDDLRRALSQSLGFAALVGRDIPPGPAAEPFAQSDLAVTVLDALGLEPAEGILGRSLLRLYESPRPLAFGNVYLDRAWGLWPGGRLYGCGPSAVSCRAWLAPGGDPFAGTGRFRSLPPDPAELATFREIIRFSSREPRAVARGPRSIPLHAAGPVGLSDTTTYRLLFGEQHMDLPPGTLEVDLAMRVTGDPGAVHVRHDVVDETGRHFVSRLPVLRPGEGFQLLYRVSSAGGWRGLSIRASADRLAGTGLGLEIQRAEATFEPALRSSEVETGVRVLDRRIDRKGDPPFDTRSLASWTELPDCLQRTGGVLHGQCPPEVLVGPGFPAPWGSRVEIQVGARGAGSARLLVGSPEAGIVLASGEKIELDPNASRTLSLATEVRAVLNEVRVALQWEPETDRGPLVVEEMQVFVQWP